jgi:hypothetical protein
LFSPVLPCCCSPYPQSDLFFIPFFCITIPRSMSRIWKKEKGQEFVHITPIFGLDSYVYFTKYVDMAYLHTSWKNRFSPMLLKTSTNCRKPMLQKTSKICHLPRRALFLHQGLDAWPMKKNNPSAFCYKWLQQIQMTKKKSWGKERFE